MLKQIYEILDKAVVSNVKTYDMTSVTPFYDNAVIGSVSSSRQGNAAIDYLRKELADHVRSYNASDDATWFIIDLNYVVVHIFVQDERLRYDLDKMYSNMTL